MRSFLGSNKLVSMDINELRGWATFLDRAVIASLIAAILAISALGLTTWFSFRFNSAVRAHEQVVVDRYKGMEGRSVELEREVATARQRVSALEREVATARDGTAVLQQQLAAARVQAATIEQEASVTRQRAEAYGRAVDEANERAARAEQETAAATAKERAVELDAAEIRKRLAELGQRVKEATHGTNPEERAPENVAPGGDKQSPPIVVSLRKYAGTKAAVFVLDQAADAPAAGAAISTSERSGLDAADVEVDGCDGNLWRGRTRQGRQRLRDDQPSSTNYARAPLVRRKETGQLIGTDIAVHSMVHTC
jgi:hypothetical protein